jgi:hypothetical protein
VGVTQVVADHSHERRQDERRHFKTTVVCQMGPRGAERAVFGQVVNISANGAQILCKGDIRSGEQIQLTFLNERRDTIADVGATVVWHRGEGPGAYRLGVNLARQLTYEEIASIA